MALLNAKEQSTIVQQFKVPFWSVLYKIINIRAFIPPPLFSKRGGDKCLGRCAALASMNKGLSEELNKTFTKVIPVKRPPINSDIIPDPN